MNGAALRAITRADLRGVLRDPMMVALLFGPAAIVVVTRFLAGPGTRWLASVHGIDVHAHRPALLAFMVVLLVPFLCGALAGFLVLDERDDDVLTALRVTPLSLSGYLTYRLAAASTLSVAGVSGGLAASGLVPPGADRAGLAAVVLLATLLAPLIALALPAIAGNKVEGLAVMKVVTLPLFLPVGAWFAAGPIVLASGLLPTAAPVQLLWGALGGRLAVAWFAWGACLQLASGVWLFRRTWRRLHG